MKSCTILLYFYLVGLCFGNPHCEITEEAPCPVCAFPTLNDIDNCYMQQAINIGASKNPAHPFGAVIVDHIANRILCTGVNNAQNLWILHGEMSAMINCSEMYPSPTGSDNKNPGLNWKNLTLYTTGESCPMCAAAAAWRGLGRLVYGSDIPTLIRYGSVQMNLRNHELFRTADTFMFNTGGMGNVHGNVPYLKGYVLANVTDQLFSVGFGFGSVPSDPQWGTSQDPFWNLDGQFCGCGRDHPHSH